MVSNTSFAGSLAAGLDKIQDFWGWFVMVGTAFIALGVVCVVGDMTATKMSVLTLGWLLVIGAVVALVQSFRTREWSGFFLYSVTALLRGWPDICSSALQQSAKWPSRSCLPRSSSLGEFSGWSAPIHCAFRVGGGWRSRA